MWANRGPVLCWWPIQGVFLPLSQWHQHPSWPWLVHLSVDTHTGDLWYAVCGCCRAESLEILCQSSQTLASASGPHGGLGGGHLSCCCCCFRQMPFDHHEHYLIILSRSWQNKLKMFALDAHAWTESLSQSSGNWRALWCFVTSNLQSQS